MNPVSRKLALTLAVVTLTCEFAQTQEPTVQAPESVQDWFRSGQRLIASAKELKPVHRRAKNVIRVVGDGMGISTVTASRTLVGQLASKPGEENQLFFETLPYVVLSKTYSWDQQTSDSAPTMTAMVTGCKARESMVSEAPKVA
jgi:alkaline phosphatase